MSPIAHKIAGFQTPKDTSILNELRNMMGNTKIQLKDNIKELYKDQKDQQSRGIRTSNVTPTREKLNQIHMFYRIKF